MIYPLNIAIFNSYVKLPEGFLLDFPAGHLWSPEGWVENVNFTKLSKNYGKSPCYKWVNQLFLWSFINSKLFVYQNLKPPYLCAGVW
jgi:hypothetical protein